MTVLVTAASKHGATLEIAAAIARALEERHLAVELADIDTVTDLTGYDAVVLGSAVYMGHWLEPARKLAERHPEDVAARPTWLFSSGPVGDPPRPKEAEAVKVDELVEQTKAVEHRLFAGKVDKSKLSFPERTMMRAVGAKEGDYRDWDEIRGWADQIADHLASEHP